jgi:autotransporter-associated beta strand protein
MKGFPHSKLLFGSMVLLPTASLHAADGTWLGATGNWSAPGTWSGGTVATDADGTASFTGVNIIANQTITLDTARTIGNITFTDATTSSHNLTISGANILTLDVTSGAPVVDVTQVNRQLTISSQVTGNDGLAKNGPGVLTLSSTATNYTGNTTINGGVLDFAAATMNSIGGGAGVRDITVVAGAAVRRNTLDNAFLNRLAETSDEITVMTGPGGATANNNPLDFSSATGANLPNAFLGNWAGNGAKVEYTGTLTPASDNYRLGGRNSNGLLGIRSVLAGPQGLIVGGTGVSGIRVNLVAGNTFSGDTVITTGAKLTLGNNFALQNSALNLGSAGGNFALAAGSNAARITGETAASNPTFGGLIGSRNLLAAFTNAVGNNETNLASSAVTGFILNPAAGKTHIYSGVIANFAAGTTIAKTGEGTQVFHDAVHTYNGSTTISAGTLVISGTGSINSSPVTINGGTFRYHSSVAYSNTLTFTNGAVAGTNWGGSLDNLTIGANRTISPGDSPGTATTGSQAWTQGGSYVWEINNATGAAGADPGWDLVNGTGTLNLTASSVSPFNILVTSLTLANAAGPAANFNEASAYSWLISDFATTVGSFAANAFNIDTSAFVNPFTGAFGVARGDSVSGGDDTQIYLTYTPIPEPRAALLGGLALVFLLRRRR